MKKRDYLKLLMTMPVDWLRKSASTPNSHMTKTDIALHHVAIRRLST